MEFQSCYDKSKVTTFLGQFLPEDFAQREEEMILPFKAEHLRKVTLLGRVSSLDNLRIYQIEHGSETDPRVSLSREAFRLMLKFGVTRALIFFISARSENYRLSLITLEIKSAGKGIEKRYSNPRRYSFYLGPKAKTLTPTKFLIQKGRVKDFADLQSRFSIEVVNKEFYAEIAELFTELAGGKRMIGSREVSETGSLRLPSVAAEAPALKEFAVRLIGRLVFCWFLKKKASSASRSLIPEELLSSTAVERNAGYYHTTLEPLFFETLNTPNEERRGRFRSHPWSEVPFLNGGLFDAHPDDFYDIGPDGHSKHINTLKVPDEWLRQLIMFFEKYNFTIDENTSVDIELSIDPEMLGRIFENLLAEINPETGETARKASGSYYTPRVIVDYMVDECLKQFLHARAGLPEKQCSSLLSFADDEPDLDERQTDRVIEVLGSIRIIDPACGSGAFPMGILQKMLHVLRKVDRDSARWREKVLGGVKDSLLRKKLKTENLDYIFKLGIIRDSIYGVDIQPIAMEISKLRFFLSLIVDEKIDDKQDNRGIQALPNLEFKFVCADSLIPLEKPETEGLLLDIEHEDQDSIRRLKELRDDYFTSHGKEKRDLERRFRETQDKMKDFYIKHAYKPRRNLRNEEIATKTPATSSLTQRLALWDPFGNSPAPWFDPEWMFGVREGFDIVIANPPYIRQEDIKEQKPKLQPHYECYTGTADYFVYFFERGVKLLKKSGVLAFITSNKYFRSGYGEKLRGFLAAQTTLHRVIDFGDAPVFSAIAYPSIVILTRETPQADHQALALSWVPGPPIDEFPSVFQKDNLLIAQRVLTSDGWRLESPAVLQLLDKLRRSGKPLGEYVNGRLYRGILTGLNEAFVVDRATRDRLIREHKTSSDILRPFLRGRDVKRWTVGFDDQYFIKIESSENKEHPWSNMPEKEAMRIFANSYPAIYEYFESLKKIKLDVPDARGCRTMWEKLQRRDDQGQFFWELRSCAYWQEFERPKIIYPDIAQRQEFAFDFKGYYSGNTTYLIPTDSTALLALLNSKLLFWIYKRLSTQIQGGFVRYFTQYLEQLPIVMEKESGVLETLTKKIMDSPSADVTGFEHKIDQRVSALYGLTSDEIKIVEEAG